MADTLFFSYIKHCELSEFQHKCLLHATQTDPPAFQLGCDQYESIHQRSAASWESENVGKSSKCLNFLDSSTMHASTISPNFFQFFDMTWDDALSGCIENWEVNCWTTSPPSRVHHWSSEFSRGICRETHLQPVCSLFILFHRCSLAHFTPNIPRQDQKSFDALQSLSWEHGEELCRS